MVESLFTRERVRPISSSQASVRTGTLYGSVNRITSISVTVPVGRRDRDVPGGGESPGVTKWGSRQSTFSLGSSKDLGGGIRPGTGVVGNGRRGFLYSLSTGEDRWSTGLTDPAPRLVSGADGRSPPLPFSAGGGGGWLPRKRDPGGLRTTRKVRTRKSRSS